MNHAKRSLLAVGAVVIVGLGIGAATINASNNDDDQTDTPITGDALAKASGAALDHTGEGRVTETEVDDEESYYEVEVTLDDGSEVDVQLDENFGVVRSTADAEDDAGDD